MDSFSNRLNAWLSANETNRRGALFTIIVFTLFSGYFGFKGFMIVAGLCLMAEGLAMLLTSAPVAQPVPVRSEPRN